MMIGRIKKHSTVWLHILVSLVPGCGLVLGGGECRVDPGVNWVSALPLVPYLWPYYDRRVTSHSLQTNTLLALITRQSREAAYRNGRPVSRIRQPFGVTRIGRGQLGSVMEDWPKSWLILPLLLLYLTF